MVGTDFQTLAAVWHRRLNLDKIEQGHIGAEKVIVLVSYSADTEPGTIDGSAQLFHILCVSLL